MVLVILLCATCVGQQFSYEALTKRIDSLKAQIIEKIEDERLTNRVALQFIKRSKGIEEQDSAFAIRIQKRMSFEEWEERRRWCW